MKGYSKICLALIFIVFCGCRGSNSDSGIVVIGESHTDPVTTSIKLALARKASNNEIALGLEGYVKGEATNQISFKSEFGVNGGLLFPLEDGFTYYWSKCLIVFGLSTLGVDESRLSNSLFLDLKQQLRHSNQEGNRSVLVSTFEDLSFGEVLNSNADASIVYLALFNFQLEPSLYNEQMLQPHGPPSSEWIAFVNVLGASMSALAETNKDVAEVFDFAIFNQFHLHPTDNSFSYVYNAIQETRDLIFFNGMKEVIEISRDKNCKAYFMVGRDHIDGLSQIFEKNHVQDVVFYLTAEDYLKSDDNIID